MKELKSYIEQLQQEMKAKLSSVDPFNDELPTLGTIVSFLRDILRQLHNRIANHQFSEVADEIDFFKNEKPIFMSQYIFHKKILSVRLLSSFQLAQDQKERIVDALRDEQAFIKKNYEFYLYCMSNSTQLDEQFFKRKPEALTCVTADPRFSTTHDNKLSRFIAGELLKSTLLDQLQNLENKSVNSTPMLTWTGSKTDLTELVYALQVVGVFNDGAADLKQVATALETMFHIHLGDYYRTFQAIQVRKNNQVSFLTKLKDRLQSKLDEKM